MKSQILLIEDEADISIPLSYSLRAEGFDVLLAEEGEEGLRLARSRNPALAILDLMLPTMDGFEVCRNLRMEPITKDMPIIMLTAKDDQSDVVIGLGLGADDYVTKPFSTPQLVARIKAVLSRGNIGAKQSESKRAKVGDLIVDTERYEAIFLGERLTLTATEFRILFALANQADRVFRRDELLNQAVGEGVFVIDRNIDVHIRSIRKKIRRPKLIKTVRGVGYRLESSESMG